MGSIFVLPDDQIEELLATALVGRIACWSPEQEGGRPYLVPLAYGYDGESVHAHGGPGRKLRIMRAQPLVSFEVDAAKATDRWRSVVAEATFEEITDPTERDAALRVIYRPPATVPPLGPETVVFRLRLTKKSGRYEIPDEA